MKLSRAIAIVGCLLVGHAAAAALFWALVNVPESNVLMLALSVLVSGAIILVLSWTEQTAVLAWDPAISLGLAARRGVKTLTPFIAAGLVFWLFWWLTTRAGAWHSAYAGEIDAWWMATTGSAGTAWIHAGVTILLWLIRYLIGGSLAVAALSAGAILGGRALVSFAWVRRGLSLRQLGPMGPALVILVLLPLQAVSWRPEAIRPTALEPAFAIGKLAAIYLVINTGWALVLRAAARAVNATSPPSPS